MAHVFSSGLSNIACVSINREDAYARARPLRLRGLNLSAGTLNARNVLRALSLSLSLSLSLFLCSCQFARARGNAEYCTQYTYTQSQASQQDAAARREGLKLKTRAITSDANLFNAARIPHQDSIQRSASRFIHPSASRGRGREEERRRPGKLYIFVYADRNGFGFLSAVPLANSPQSSTWLSPLVIFCQRAFSREYQPFATPLARCFCTVRAKGRSIGERFVSGGKGRTMAND